MYETGKNEVEWKKRIFFPQKIALSIEKGRIIK